MRGRFIIFFMMYLALGLCGLGWVLYVFFTEARPRWKWLASVPVIASTGALFAGPIEVLGWVALFQVILAGLFFILVWREG